jgi:hypothetical protein
VVQSWGWSNAGMVARKDQERKIEFLINGLIRVIT